VPLCNSRKISWQVIVVACVFVSLLIVVFDCLVVFVFSLVGCLFGRSFDCLLACLFCVLLVCCLFFRLRFVSCVGVWHRGWRLRLMWLCGINYCFRLLLGCLLAC